MISVNFPWRSGRREMLEARSLREDLRRGEAPTLVRVGLSVAAIGAVLAPVLLAVGLVEAAGARVGDEVTLGLLPFAGLLWCWAMTRLWSSHPRWPRVLATAFRVLAVWMVAIPVIVLIEETVWRADLLTASVAVLAGAATLALVATVPYRRPGGRQLVAPGRAIRVQCPACGYSLVGLESCRCPECGATFTIDSLILAQDYAVLRPGREAADPHRALEAADPAPAGPPVLAEASPPADPPP